VRSSSDATCPHTWWPSHSIHKQATSISIHMCSRTYSNGTSSAYHRPEERSQFSTS
jgi:hypothetical protein